MPDGFFYEALMALSKARRAELEQELLKTMDRLDALKVELRDAQRENRQQVQLHQKKLLELRDILSGREGDQLRIEGSEVGDVKPPKARRAAPKAEAARVGPSRPKGEIVRWVADARARKVPTFVVEQTGIRTKAGIIAKWGENSVFEKGKACPRDKDGLHSWERKPGKAKKKADRCSRCRGEDAETTMEGLRVCWSCAYKVQEEAEQNRKAQKERVAAGLRAAEGEILWEAEPDADGVRHGTTHDLLKIEVWLAAGGWKWQSNTRMRGAGGFPSEAMARQAAEVAERDRCRPEPDELCLDCGKPPNEPSEGCDGCHHGRPPADEVDVDELVGTREEAIERHQKGAK